jgi:elongation factor Ts
MKAYYDQACFVCQKYIKDNSMSVAEFVAAEAKKLGKNASVHSFKRWKSRRIDINYETSL